MTNINEPKISKDVFGVTRPEKGSDEDDMKRMSLESKVINLLYCTIDPNEFNGVFTCESTKEI